MIPLSAPQVSDNYFTALLHRGNAVSLFRMEAALDKSSE